MSKALFFHLRKQIKVVLPNEFGTGKQLQPSDDFNHDGRITYAHGDFDDLVAKLQQAVGQMYVVQHNQQVRSIVIKRITDIH